MSSGDDVLRNAEHALEEGTRPQGVCQRYGMAAARQKRLGELRSLLYDYDGPDGDRALSNWCAELVDAGRLVPRGDDGD